MIKKTIKYEDFDGNKKMEDHYFHLFKSAIIDMELSSRGGLVASLMKVVKSGDNISIMKFFRKLIEASYGIRLDDGTFSQSKKRSRKFMKSEAYDALITELMSNPLSTLDFIRGMLPRDVLAAAPQELDLPDDLKQEIQKSADSGEVPDDLMRRVSDFYEKAALSVSSPGGTEKTSSGKVSRELTPAELRELSHEQLLELFMRKSPGSGEKG